MKIGERVRKGVCGLAAAMKRFEKQCNAATAERIFVELSAERLERPESPADASHPKHTPHA
jgi:hypothetical protein